MNAKYYRFFEVKIYLQKFKSCNYDLYTFIFYDFIKKEKNFNLKRILEALGLAGFKRC